MIPYSPVDVDPDNPPHGFDEPFVLHESPWREGGRLYLNLYTLLRFHPDRHLLTQALYVIRERGWNQTSPYLVAAVFCSLHGFTGDEAWNHRAACYARKGGYDPVALGIR